MEEHLAYFDNAATTFPKPEEVYLYMDNFYRECGVNAGRGQHKLSAKANALIEDTRKRLLNLFHCPNKQIIFTPTATEALNLIISGVKIPAKANVYISPFEHNAVIRALHHLQNKIYFEVRYLDVGSSDMQYDMNRIKKQFEADNPFLIIVSHASNVCGAVAPLNNLFVLAKQYKAITVADMCQTAGLIDVDLSSDIYDYAVFEGHKTLYGPMGVGGLIAKPNITLEPLIYGGTGFESASLDMPDVAPMKYEAGSHNIQAIAGLYAALKWIDNTGISVIMQKEQDNRNKLISILQSYDNIKIINPPDAIGVISCLFDGYSSDSIGQVLNDHNIAVRTGLHCSPVAHKFLGTFPAGTVRFSVSYFNSDEDFAKLIEALDFIEINS